MKYEFYVKKLKLLSLNNKNSNNKTNKNLNTIINKIK